MQDIYTKLEKVLEKKFPFKEERDEIIERSGQIVIGETSQEIFEMLSDAENKKTFAELINKGKIEEAISFAQKQGISIEDIFEKKCVQVTSLVFSM